MIDVEKYKHAIQGWCDYGGVYKEAVDKFPSGSVFVEVGCWKGQSTAIMAELIQRSQKDIKFYAVDTFDGQFDCGEQMVYIDIGENIFTIFWSNMQKYNFHHLITPIISSSHNCKPFIKEKLIDFVFLDGNFNDDSVQKDLEYFFPIVKKHGIIAGHAVKPSSRKIVDDFFLSKKLSVRKEIGGEIWIVEKTQ